jgi:3-dehydroquinate synthase
LPSQPVQPEQPNQPDQPVQPNHLTLTTATASYPVVVAAGALQDLPATFDALNVAVKGAVWLISDSEVFPRHGEPLVERLRDAGYVVHTRVVPSGEASKSNQHLWDIHTWMLRNGVERRDTVLALGGGVVGDLAGFAAATILRGIGVIQLPTTLLAMVDASIGGKTGINHPLGKNLIGAFHQPRLVLADTHTLVTLPERELRAGWAEVIKHGVIRDVALFEQLEAKVEVLTDMTGVQNPDSPTHEELSHVIHQAAAVKVDVVSNDEKEQGLRIILNYGHTIGHALEATTGYGTFLHGEAVAVGMDAAARIAQEMGLFSQEEVERQRALLTAYGLPTTVPANIDHVDHARVLALTLHDKKVQGKRIRWVLPTAIGEVTVRDDVADELVQRAVGAT